MIRGTVIASVIGLLALALPAWADCGSCEKKVSCGKCEVKCPKPCCKKPHADIERLEAVKPECSSTVCVKWQVEVSNICPDSTEQFDLVVQIKDKCGSVLSERVIELDCPFKENNHKRVYKAAFDDQLACAETEKGLKIEANVVCRGTRASIDRERETVHSRANSIPAILGNI